jgi:hypothetical protein
MKPALYLAIDNESGGIEGCSLLTTYLAALDEDMSILGELELFVRPNDGKYVVEGQGMSVNNINLVEHDEKAISYSEAGKRLREFIIQWSENGKTKLLPLGHGVAWDVRELNTYLLKHENWEQFVSYRKLDTSAIAQFLKTLEIIPSTVTGGLGSLTAYFGILHEAHTAKGDVLATIAVFRAMKDLIQRR